MISSTCATERACKECGSSGCYYAMGMCKPCYMKKWRSENPCKIDGCKQPGQHNGYCAPHLRRVNESRSDPVSPRRRGVLGWVGPDGYRRMRIKGSRKLIPEQRLVMERFVGRKLTTDETVHHKNGDRLDNRIENLELWSGSHPSGQRVHDKVLWSLDLLDKYEQQIRPINVNTMRIEGWALRQ